LQQLKRKYWYMRLWHISRPSVVYPSALSVTLLHARQKLELFGNILHRLLARGLGQFVLKFLNFGQKFEGVLWNRIQVKYKGV